MARAEEIAIAMKEALMELADVKFELIQLGLDLDYAENAAQARVFADNDTDIGKNAEIRKVRLTQVVDEDQEVTRLRLERKQLERRKYALEAEVEGDYGLLRAFEIDSREDYLKYFENSLEKGFTNSPLHV